MGGLVLALSLASGLLAQGQPSWGEPALERDLQRVMEQHDIDGVVLLMVEGDQVVYLNGFGQNAEGEPMDIEATFDLGRAAEPFLTTAIMMQAERGLLAPDINLPNLLPTIRLPETPYGLTLSNLMNHTAGFGGDSALPIIASLEQNALQGETPPSIQRFSYCPNCTALLGTLISQTGGIAPSEFLQEKVFYPLQMDATHTEDGHLFTTPQDLSHFMAVHLLAGRWGSVQLIKPETIEAMHKARVQTGRNRTEQYGFGWWVQPESGLDVREIGQDRILNARDIGNYQAQITLVPGYRRGIAILTDQPTHGLDPLMDVVIKHFIDWEAPPFDLIELDGVVGTLTSDHPTLGGELVFEAVSEDELQVSYNGETAPAYFTDTRTVTFDLPDSGPGSIFFLEPWRAAQGILMLNGQTAIYQRQY
jgi:hypothetical protein